MVELCTSSANQRNWGPARRKHGSLEWLEALVSGGATRFFASATTVGPAVASRAIPALQWCADRVAHLMADVQPALYWSADRLVGQGGVYSGQ